MPREFLPLHRKREARAKADSGVRIDEHAEGRARIETYAAIYAKGVPSEGFVVARLEADGARCLAWAGRAHPASLASLFEETVIGRSIDIRCVAGRHTFELAAP